MMNSTCRRVAGLMFISVSALTAAQVAPCPTLVTTLVPQMRFSGEVRRLPRIELRRCEPDLSDLLQIVAWTADASAPSLVVDTNRGTITQMLMSRDVFVLETAGGTTDVVQVIVFDNGVPRLVLERYIKGVAEISADRTTVKLRIPREGGAPEVVEYRTGRK